MSVKIVDWGLLEHQDQSRIDFAAHNARLSLLVEKWTVCAPRGSSDFRAYYGYTLIKFFTFSFGIEFRTRHGI